MVISRLTVAICVLMGATGAGAQATATLAQLDGRASPALRAELAVVADSMTRAGLPIGPVIDKSLEGISKGASDQRIIAAVRAVATDLGVARHALGPSSDHELAAAVAALRAGSSASALGELRRALPGRSLVVPLSVLSSLLVEGAPASSAMLAVVTNARQRDDANLLAFSRAVSRNIAGGVAPVAAMQSAQAADMPVNSFTPTAATPAKTRSSSTPKPKP